VGVGAPEHGEAAGVGVDAVLDEGALAQGKPGGVDLFPVLADVAKLGPELRTLRALRSRDRRGARGGDAHRVEELLVARAAAHGPGEGVGYLLAGGLGRALSDLRAAEELVYGEGDGGSAVAALDAGGVDEGALHDAELAVLREAVDGPNSFRPSAWTARIWQELTEAPSRMTAQSPQEPSPSQPLRTETMPLARSAFRSVTPGSKSQDTALPLNVKSIFMVWPRSGPRLGAGLRGAA
jgi:hypothetical protein